MTTPTLYTSITAAHWQPAHGTSRELIEGLRDIYQSILIIHTTSYGAEVHRQDLGSDLALYFA
jgi:phage baseplate assembly protein W